MNDLARLQGEEEEKNRAAEKKKRLELTAYDVKDTLNIVNERQGLLTRIEERSGLRFSINVITADCLTSSQPTAVFIEPPRLACHAFISNYSNYLFINSW